MSVCVLAIVIVIAYRIIGPIWLKMFGTGARVWEPNYSNLQFSFARAIILSALSYAYLLHFSTRQRPQNSQWNFNSILRLFDSRL